MCLPVKAVGLFVCIFGLNANPHESNDSEHLIDGRKLSVEVSSTARIVKSSASETSSKMKSGSSTVEVEQSLTEAAAKAHTVAAMRSFLTWNDVSDKSAMVSVKLVFATVLVVGIYIGFEMYAKSSPSDAYDVVSSLSRSSTLQSVGGDFLAHEVADSTSVPL